MTPVNLAHRELVRTAAKAYDLSPEIVCAVVEQESNWNPWAMRYEPAFFRRYIQPMIVSGDLKAGTETLTRSISWGLMQVMGQVAREQGFVGRWLSELCDPATGLDIGCRVLRHKLDVAEGDMKLALLRYNGGSNTLYPDQVLGRVDNYREEKFA